LVAIVDAAPLIAAADRQDRNYSRCIAVLQRADLRLVIPTMVVAEATYLIGRELGPMAEATFLRSMSHFDVEAPLPEDWHRIADLVQQYADFPLGPTDASIVALAERLETDIVITLDRRHFGAIRPLHVEALKLLPD
jgi:uncharacterized protein